MSEIEIEDLDELEAYGSRFFEDEEPEDRREHGSLSEDL